MVLRVAMLLVAVAVAVALAGGCRAGTRPAPSPAKTEHPTTARAASRDEGRDLFYRVVNGEKQLLRRCEEHWARRHRDDPRDPLATAYLGATIAFSASAEAWPPRKGELAKRGLGLLEDAVSAAPENVEVRFLRGMTSQSLPAFMGRRGVAREDLAFAAKAASAAVQTGDLPLFIATASLYQYGVMCEADGDSTAARTAWEAATQLGPDTAAGRKAATKRNRCDSN